MQNRSRQARVAPPEPLVFDDEPMDAMGDGHGVRVFHQKFGYGTILQVDGQTVEVAFDKAGTKKVIGTFLEKVG